MNRTVRIALLSFAGAALVIGIASLWRWTSIQQWAERPHGDPSEVALAIAKGSSLSSIAMELEGAGIVDDANRFRSLAVIEGKGRSLQAGRYAFTLPLTPLQVLDELRHGTFQRKVTIPEGWTSRQIARGLVQEGWIEREKDWLDVAREPVDATHLGFVSILGSEGFSFPETYYLEPGATAPEIRDRMLAEFGRVWTSLEPERRDPRSAKLNPLQVVTLASMVQREARSVEEMPDIASVYLNRLKIRMRLQCCATVHYAIGEVWDRALTYEDLKVDSPFNTYQHYGLPPAPIGNPGREALEAVLRPADSDYLFYVYRGDGTHEFTRTYREHRRAARRYRDSDPTAEFVRANGDAS